MRRYVGGRYPTCSYEDVAGIHLVRDVTAGFLVTFGIVPDTPETGYGYIQRGEALTSGSAHRVARFVEKPNLENAEKFLSQGDYYWNSSGHTTYWL